MTTTPRHFLNRWFLMALVTWVCSLFVVISSATMGAPQKKQEGSISDLKIESLKVENGDMEEALRLLRRKDPHRILIGFEEVPHREEEKDMNISFELTDATVVEILDHLCAADPRYTYEVVGDALINVLPKGVMSDPNYLLNIIVRNFEFHGNELPHNLIINVGHLARELREHLGGCLAP